MERFVTAFVLSFLLIIPFAAANVELTLSKSELTLFTGTYETVDLTIKNSQAVADSFSVIIFPSTINKVSAFPSPERVSLPAGENGTVKLYFSALIDALETPSPIVFNITVNSISNASVVASKNVNVNLKRTIAVFISEVKTNETSFYPDEGVEISVVVTNGGGLESEKYTLVTSLLKAGKTIQRYTDVVDKIAARSTKTVTHSYQFDRYAAPGGYVITVSLKDKTGLEISSGSKNVEVKELYKLPAEYTEKTTSIGILTVSVEIKVKNEGNVKTPSFYVTECVPTIAKDLFEPEIQPAVVNATLTKITYSWFVETLEPGKEIIIKYRFNLWKAWLGLLAICGAVYFAFKYVFTISLTKRCKSVGPLTKEKEITVTLEVKNMSVAEVKDVVVRDLAPTITEVVGKFGTLKAATKKTGVGIELTWKFDSLRPGEERVLTYSIKPKVDIIGRLKLPAAVMRYTDRKKEKKIKYSERVLIKQV